MNTEYRYILEKGSKKHHCPNCEKKRFVRYIDTHTGEYLPERYGRCDREVNCPQLEYNNPYKDGYAKAIWEQEQGNKTDWKPQRPKRINKPEKKRKTVYIPDEVLNSTLKAYDQNIFVQNLLYRVPFPFEVNDIERVISLFRLGTVPETGAVCFPFIDSKGNINAVQEKIFDCTNHTDKSKKYHISWLHSRLTFSKYKNEPLPDWLEAYNKNETKVSCLFGEHLLGEYSHNPVALVEAPKTAIYGTLYLGLPDEPTNLLWLAVGNLRSFNLIKSKALKNRKVFLFPDLSKNGKAFELWSNKATEIQKRLKATYFYVSDILEQLAPDEDKERGKDIADYLIQQDWRLYRPQPTKETQQPEPEPVKASSIENNEHSTEWKPDPLDEAQQPEPPKDWSSKITELEIYFSNIDLPTRSIKLNECSTITDCALFVMTHLKALKVDPSKPVFKLHLNRLQELQNILTTAKQ